MLDKTNEENAIDNKDYDFDFNFSLEEDKIHNEQKTIFRFGFYNIYKPYEKCVCKIIIKADGKENCGTGFFCYLPSKQMRVLITNNHIIDQNFLDKEEKLTIYLEEKEKQEKIIIDLNSGRFKITNKELDYTLIEILDEDLIDDFFEVDENETKNEDFINESVFNLQFTKGQYLNVSFGKIIVANKKGPRIFLYDAGTDEGSSGSPIISTNGAKIIGLHKGCYTKNVPNKLNVGIYLYEIFQLIPKSTHLENKNAIKCLYDIEKKDVNKDIQVYDNEKNIEKYITSYSIYRQDEKKREIIDGKFRFEKEGKYLINYYLDKSATNLSEMFNKCDSLIKVYMPSFSDNKITEMAGMFENCYSLKNINIFYSFNTKNVIDMSNMFSNCYSLEKLNLSLFTTSNVQNMSGLFNECKSLKKINLSSFNTEKVTDMSKMFNGCEQLQEINLASFNTKNVEDMSYMFSNCEKLSEINLKSFDTKNVEDISYMFELCKSLQKLDLSSFNIKNVTKMKGLFKRCLSLKEINLPTFHTNKNTKMKDMFSGCNSLRKIDHNDKKIEEEFKLIYDLRKLN